jgi:hypothetical protein
MLQGYNTGLTMGDICHNKVLSEDSFITGVAATKTKLMEG